jgi:transposase
MERPKRENFLIPISNGLLRDGHCARMGKAVWTFMWLIDKSTKNVEIEGKEYGQVLGGKPITQQEIASELKVDVSTVKRHLSRLRRKGYIMTKRTPYGFIAYVANPKKRRGKCALSGRKRKGKNAPTDRADVTRRGGKCDLSNKDSTVDSTVDIYDQRFDVFWQAYPRKVGKKPARKAWERIKPSKELLGKMLKSIQAARESKAWKKDNGEYIPHPSTWLNQERWEDEYEVQAEEEKYL